MNEKIKKNSVILGAVVVIVIIGVSALYLSASITEETQILLLATTTSTANSGLLDYIIPEFENSTKCIVKITPVGTGQALEMGRRGDADVLLVHAPEKEIEFVEQGYGSKRTLVMYNEFVIVGPSTDPANCTNLNVSNAMKQFYQTQENFASRGDNSGTHMKESSLWILAGYDYETEIDLPENTWYYSVSSGMGDCLTRANELQAYTLTDEGTYYAYQNDLDLDIIVKGDSILFNQYSVIPIRHTLHDHVNYQLAQQFVQWLTSTDTQEMIGEFEANGKQLFTPNAE